MLVPWRRARQPGDWLDADHDHAPRDDRGDGPLIGGWRQKDLNWIVRLAQIYREDGGNRPENAIAKCGYFFTNKASEAVKP